MSGRPLVPAFAAETVTVGDWLDRQVQMLLEAGGRGARAAERLLRAVGDPSAAPGLDAARAAIARDHGYADWAAAAEHARERVDTRFEAAADAIQWGEVGALRAPRRRQRRRGRAPAAVPAQRGRGRTPAARARRRRRRPL